MMDLKARNVEIYRARQAGDTFRAIGARFGISRDRASQIAEKMERVERFTHDRAVRLSSAASWRDILISDVEISTRAKNCAAMANVMTLGRLYDEYAAGTFDDLDTIPNMGIGVIREIEACLAERLLSFAMREERMAAARKARMVAELERRLASTRQKIADLEVKATELEAQIKGAS